MNKLPESPDSRSGLARSPATLLLRLSRWLVRPLSWMLLLGLGAAVVGLLIAWQRSDLILGRLYNHWRPWLQSQVGRVMGRPLELGPYQGFGLEGVRIGPSRFLPGSGDASTAGVKGLVVRVDPLASWRDRTLRLEMDLQGAKADLRRNANGQLWTFGRVPPGRTPPRIALTFRLLEPGQVRLWNLGANPQPLVLDLQGQARVEIHQQSVEWRAKAQTHGKPGVARVHGGGDWSRQRWQTEVFATRWEVAPLIRLLPLPGRVSGEGTGQLALSLEKGQGRCEGAVVGEGLRWQLNPTAPVLQLPRAPLRCKEQRLFLATSDWRVGPWAGRVSGDLENRRLSLQALARPPQGLDLGPLPLRGRMESRIGKGGLQDVQLFAQRGGSRITATGRLGRELELEGTWEVALAEFPRLAKLPPWLQEGPLGGTGRLGGRWASPRLAVATGQPRHSLLGPWRADLVWADGRLAMPRFEAEHLQAGATLPLALQPGRGWVAGPLEARLHLAPYPLARLNPLLGTALDGLMEARGVVRGPLRHLRPDLDLRLQRPRAGPLRLEETWTGRLQAELDPANPLGGQVGGGVLRMAATVPSPPGQVEAWLDRRWQPVRMTLQRDGGRLRLQGTPERYAWTAHRLPLQGLALAFGQRMEPLQGLLSGKGEVGFQPLMFQGDGELSQPRFLGLPGRRVQARVRYANRAYQLRGVAEPLGAGSVDMSLEGRWQGPFRARFQARQLDGQVFRDLLAFWNRGRGAPARRWGVAEDLGQLVFDTLGTSVDAQLLALRRAIEETQGRNLSLNRPQGIGPLLAALQTSVDADLTLQGPDWKRVQMDLDGSGYLWVGLPDRDQALTSTPFSVQLAGPLGGGQGRFQLGGVPLALLALLTPVPETLRGRLAVNGRYRLGGKPGLEMALALEDGAIGPVPLTLDRGALTLEKAAVRVDLAARGGGSSNPVTLAGTLPLNPRSGGLELRLASRGDGLRVLTQLAGDAVVWKRGSTDLQLLVRGSLSDPIANGFIRLRGGEYKLAGQTLSDVEATVLFDFEQVLVQELQARAGRRGRLQGEGRIGLWRQLGATPTLALQFKEVPFATSRITARSDGRLTIGGTLGAPVLGGELAISRGKINALPGELSPTQPVSHSPAKPSSMAELLEQKWDFQQPLVLLGPQIQSVGAGQVEESIPRLPWLSFQDLRLRFGPDLRVVVPNVASFDTGGSLKISGPLDPSLRASGVVRLLSGRLNLFTTAFSLDPEAPNVAVFTPSLGLVPYLDIALRTRIADNLGLVTPSGFGEAQTGGGVATGPTAGAPDNGFSSLRQLNLILVTMSVSGPADRIADSIRLSSNPPLPQERLVALIGGNSLAGLSQGGAGTALATIVGQSLLSPLLSGLSDALGQRVSLALYPTYVNPEIANPAVRESRRVPPQLVLGAEVGVDITDRLNLSVLGAPNRSDVAPQITLNYKASEALNLEAFVDTLGSWGAQLQMLIRF
ncbi:MAG: translocation/assembly module TamB domain-containing protein [Cyanobacteriota bacterium]|nr:translocation/assembly module TamB domain-containing protein [Cyanobacteriota bacterium]